MLRLRIRRETLAAADLDSERHVYVFLENGGQIAATPDAVPEAIPAIQEANALTGTEAITVPAGVYPISLRSLAITGPVTITGAGVGRTALDGGRRSFRIVIVAANARPVTVSALTIRNGGDYDGFCDRGGLEVEPGANVVLRTVVLSGNTDECVGGAIRDSGTLRVDQSVLSNNDSDIGGGI